MEASALFLHAAGQPARPRANETRHDGDPTRWRPDMMARRQFHLSWFLSQGYGPKTWRGNWPGSDVARWMMPDLFLDLARGLERACFDYVIIEDSYGAPGISFPARVRHSLRKFSEVS